MVSNLPTCELIVLEPAEHDVLCWGAKGDENENDASENDRATTVDQNPETRTVIVEPTVFAQHPGNQLLTFLLCSMVSSCDNKEGIVHAAMNAVLSRQGRFLEPAEGDSRAWVVIVDQVRVFREIYGRLERVISDSMRILPTDNPSTAPTTTARTRSAPTNSNTHPRARMISQQMENRRMGVTVGVVGVLARGNTMHRAPPLPQATDMYGAPRILPKRLDVLVIQGEIGAANGHLGNRSCLELIVEQQEDYVKSDCKAEVVQKLIGVLWRREARFLELGSDRSWHEILDNRRLQAIVERKFDEVVFLAKEREHQIIALSRQDQPPALPKIRHYQLGIYPARAGPSSFKRQGDPLRPPAGVPKRQRVHPQAQQVCTSSCEETALHKEKHYSFWDVLVGKDLTEEEKAHPGNQYLQLLIETHCSNLSRVGSSTLQNTVLGIIQSIHERKGRFVEKGKDATWHNITDEKRLCNLVSEMFASNKLPDARAISPASTVRPNEHMHLSARIASPGNSDVIVGEHVTDLQKRVHPGNVFLRNQIQKYVLQGEGASSSFKGRKQWVSKAIKLVTERKGRFVTFTGREWRVVLDHTYVTRWVSVLFDAFEHLKDQGMTGSPVEEEEEDLVCVLFAPRSRYESRFANTLFTTQVQKSFPAFQKAKNKQEVIRRVILTSLSQGDTMFFEEIKGLLVPMFDLSRLEDIVQNRFNCLMGNHEDCDGRDSQAKADTMNVESTYNRNNMLLLQRLVKENAPSYESSFNKKEVIRRVVRSMLAEGGQFRERVAESRWVPVDDFCRIEDAVEKEMRSLSGSTKRGLTRPNSQSVLAPEATDDDFCRQRSDSWEGSNASQAGSDVQTVQSGQKQEQPDDVKASPRKERPIKEEDAEKNPSNDGNARNTDTPEHGEKAAAELEKEVADFLNNLYMMRQA